MPGYADVEDPVALLNRAPDTSGGPTVEDAVREAGFEVQAVDWVWRKVVGESLVDSIIKPITGDFEKIARQAGEWRNVKDALQAVRNNLNAGLTELQPAWQGESADRFRNLIGTKWTLGIEADAQAASLIGLALSKVAEGSKRACDQALKLIKTLVDKLIEAAAMLPIPVVGWGRAVKLVYDGIQIYNAIMQLIEGIKAIIQGAQQVIQGVQQVGTALSKIDDIHDLNDALNVANEAGEGAANIHSGAQGIKDGATQAAGATGDLARHGTSAADNARGLHDERSANTDPSGTAHSQKPGDPNQRTDPSGNPRPANPNDTKTPLQRRECKNDPVDVATGEVVLGQVDVVLPGALPLVLRRTHISSYRGGKLFGPNWASTLDQRLVRDDQGIVFVAEDGMLLVYPEPGAGSVLPKVGPRWPLSTADSGYVIKPADGPSLHFSGAGAELPISAIVDRNGNRIEFDRDGAGTLTSVRHAGGYQVDVDTTDGRVTGVRLRNGDGSGIPMMRYGYDTAGRLAEVINSSNRALRFEYDPAGHLAQWTDRNGAWYRYRYDEAGRCVANQGAGGYLNGTFSYDTDNRITRFTDALGNTTIYLVNDRNNIVAETDPLGNTVTREWDERDRMIGRTDALGHTARYAYDEHGNLVGATMPDGTQASAEYNALGLPTVNVDPDGAAWRQEYDERGNLVTATDPAGATTRYERDERGVVTAIIDALGNRTTIEADARGLPIAVTTPLGATTRYDRDQFGRLTSVTDALGSTIRLAWTIEGKLLSRTFPDGRVERWRYDGEGSPIEHIDVLGQVTRAETTQFDLVSATIDRTGARTRFGYDANLRLTEVTNPQGLVWHYEYDAAGNLVRERDFNGRTISYTHDAAGDLVERTNGAGETTHYTRDRMGRVIEQRAGEDVATFEFDTAGRIARAVNQDAELTVERDVLGRVVAETVNGSTTTFSYDTLGRVIGRRTPTGVESTWTYDQSGRAKSLRSAGRLVSFGYDALGREVQRLLDTGTSMVQTWDINNRMLSQTVTGKAGVVTRRQFHYRADNNLSAIEDLAGIRRFDLDAVGRVTGVEGPGWRERYAYDAAGNVAAAQWPAETSEAGARGAREYAGTTLQRAGDVRYQHDQQGRIVMRQRKRLSRKADVWHYTWDAQDRLVGVVTPDGAHWRYRYDPLGRRIAKQRVHTDDSVLEHITFTWHGTELCEQVHSSGKAITWDFDGDFRPVTQLERLASASQEWIDSRFYAIVTDLAGTPTELLDLDGNPAWRASTTVWGEAIGRLTHQADTPLRFPGQYHDGETGLNYNYFRYYDPETARYGSADPLGLQPSINPYAYVRNPHRLMDPLGLMTCDEAERVLATTDPNDPANQRIRSQAWNQLYVGEERDRGARRVSNDIDAGRGPRELRGGRVDAPVSSVEGSQYHVQGPGRGTPGLNQDGTFHDGDPGWSRRTYEYLYEHGWAWPKENPPPGEPPTHRPW
jgi:RHS repeat-associated protein